LQVYDQFLIRLKGTSINSKDNLIQILNKKPILFLTKLSNFVTSFKNYNKQLTRNILTRKSKDSLNNSNIKDISIFPAETLPLNKEKNRLKPLSHLLLNKISPNLASAARSGDKDPSLLILNNNKSPKSLLNLSALTTSNLTDLKSYLLINKINQLKTSLYNNKLAIPLNLLTSLLNINSISSLSYFNPSDLGLGELTLQDRRANIKNKRS